MNRILTISALAVVIVGYLLLLNKPELPAPSSGADIGGAFTLTSDEGQTVTEKNLMGRPSLVYFGFTYCPDICPAGLLTINTASQPLTKALGDAAPKAYFITLDAARDTVENLHAYMENFPAVTGLTGTEAQIEQAAKAYRVYYRKVQDEGKAADEYMIDHSGYIYLMDDNGQYLTHFPHYVSVEELTKGVIAAVEK